MLQYKHLPFLLLFVLLRCNTAEKKTPSPEAETNSPLTQFADSLFQNSVDSAYIAGASVLVYQNG